MTLEENLKFRENEIKSEFKNILGYDLNLEEPKTFNEKIQWLKLYYHDPLMTKCADKYLVREYVKEKIGEKYLIPLLGVWDNPDDIDFDSLPNQFVLKTNWGCAQNIIVKDKSKINIDEVKIQLKEWLQYYNNLYYNTYEWQYKNINPKIICEEYLEQIDNQVYDYKIFCFNGEPKYIQVDVDRFTNHKRNMYDINWNKLELRYVYDNHNNIIDKPIILDDILILSKLLSNSFLFVRSDFYIINGNILFGELTFTSENGMGIFDPIEWDYKFGELLELPKEKKLEYDIIDKETLLRGYSNLELLVNEIRYLKSVNKKIPKKSFVLFGLFILEEYIQIYIFGIKISIKRTEQNRTEQNRTEQNRTEQNRTEQNRTDNM